LIASKLRHKKNLASTSNWQYTIFFGISVIDMHNCSPYYDCWPTKEKIGCKALYLPQFFSSELSPQSFLWSHLRNKAWIQRPLSHVNWDGLHIKSEKKISLLKRYFYFFLFIHGKIISTNMLKKPIIRNILYATKIDWFTWLPCGSLKKRSKLSLFFFESPQGVTFSKSLWPVIIH